MTSTLVLLRHGQSIWNADNLFTGWWDVDLSESGKEQAIGAGDLMAEAGIVPDVVHTSLQTRAIRTAQLALDQIGLLWLPVRRSWRLNERHYGALTGQNKAEATAQFGAEQVHIWRRSYGTRPEPIAEDSPFNPNHDRRYAHLAPEVLPLSECLRDVVVRMLPYWFDAIVDDLAAGKTVLVAAHGNSLRALVKHLDRISDGAIADLDLPTGVPFVYELDGAYRPIENKPPLDRALGDPTMVRAAAEAVARQAQAGPPAG